MDRRSLLAVCAGMLMGGCFGLSNRPRARIDWIRLVNERDQAATVTVIVAEGTDRVFTETYHVGTGSKTAVIKLDQPVASPGQYVVRFDVDSQLVNVNLVNGLEEAQARIGVEFVLHEGGTFGYAKEIL